MKLTSETSAAIGANPNKINIERLGGNAIPKSAFPAATVAALIPF
ncbi:UNVERIFIED_ORG: hypothetical protein ABIC97_000590 [Peribacillus simplex]